MSSADYRLLHKRAREILQAAFQGPYLPEDYPPNLASWVGADTMLWQIVMFFKRGTDDRAWFCHVDIEWQRTFLMIVAVELLHTTEPTGD